MRFAPVLLLIAFNAYAEDRNAAKQVGREIASSNRAKLHANVTGNINNNKAAEILNYKGTDVPEKAYADGNMYGAATAKIVDENFTAGQIVQKGFERQGEFKFNLKDSFLDKARDAQKHPENYVDWLSGKYTDCKQEGGEEILSSKKVTCDEYHEIKENSCKIGHVVEVDAKHEYECSRKRKIINKTCSKKLKAWCERREDCDSGGIILTSLASDMKWVYSYPILTLGTIADNYWRSSCGNFARSTTFQVKNKEHIDEFRIVEVGYDDYLRITINGTQVYNGPFGGDKLEITSRARRRVVDTGAGGKHSCELNTNRHASVSIDLIPYLKEGANELVMEVVVAGAGEGWAKIRTKQHCCDLKTEWQVEECNQ